MNILLQKFTPSDAENLAELGNNPKIAGNLRDSFPHPFTLEHARSFIEAAQSDETSIRRAIEWNGQYVGNIGLHFADDVYRHNVEIGYFIGEPFWGKGIASLAVQRMLEFGFQDERIHRIYAGVFDYNIPSMRVLEKAGFRKEGVALESVIKGGKIYDEHRYAILRSEFLTLK